MTTGSFQVGETVKGVTISTGIGDETIGGVDAQITFRVAQLNHKKGYWMKSSGEFEFSWELDANGNFTRKNTDQGTQLYLDMFNFERSMKQAFYFVETIEQFRRHRSYYQSKSK